MATTRSSKVKIIAELKEEGMLIGLKEEALRDWTKEELKGMDERCETECQRQALTKVSGSALPTLRQPGQETGHCSQGLVIDAD